MSDRNSHVKQHIIARVKNGDLPPSSQWHHEDAALSKQECIDLFESQVISRHLDLHSRVMQKQGQSFYTIGSAGHEGNAAYGKAFRYTDMAFLHYRSGAFFVQRAKQVPGETTIYDMLLSFAASSDDPISGGRHKVLGSKTLFVPPQTSTIASHLPKAVGTAFSIQLAKNLNVESTLPNDGVVVCNFGDASSNHSTAQGAINAAAWAAYQNIRLPLVFICEDNGIGISTPTPSGWIHANFAHRAGLIYISCNGLDILDTYIASQRAEKIAREKQKPVFLHVRLVRLLGHAGSDTESSYRKKEAIEETENNDPLLHTASMLIDQGLMAPGAICDLYVSIDLRVQQVAAEVISKPKLDSAKAIMQSIMPKPTEVLKNKQKVARIAQIGKAQRDILFQHEKHNLGKKQHLAKLLNWTLLDLMAQHNNIILCGEDVGKKGGVYSVTTKLIDKFGSKRVINTLLDEQSILGLSIGLAHNNFLPIPEIQFLAYVHNAEDQIRGEAATLPFFSNGQYTNPMVIRIAGLAYQKGFGGHFHNDNSFAVFRDIPGLVIACPSNAKDAVLLLREAVRLANEESRVVIFIEPIALYMQKDLLSAGDGLWTHEYHAPNAQQDKKQAQGLAIHASHAGEDKNEALSIITYGNGYYLSMQAQARLRDRGINIRVIDLRWLAPLDEIGIITAVKNTVNVLIVDECRQTASISEAVVTLLQEQTEGHKLSRICAQDSFIPLGKAAYEVLPSCEQIIDKVLVELE
ncbi:thiamine pyrophosphate-dependent enzyme [Glaciecola petra]|uniref:3-methyl-2-oxobutanoate dehydrogenase (2-methylpropanoyl-transferring) n=1 Tax=Glaciecola petra TaxID=3075602 RepID=A0ABU2ZQF2_9ALTE|nr:thiamine pyrophosphate-dependent enzyme [Aestuariibacter sp. P117]MDT0594564.1 thiamine pyrophosphate-dependent enzyme [Aestuariibacter sp. P117]